MYVYMNRDEIANASLSELMNRNKVLVRRMNERIRSFRKEDETSYALNLMEDYLENLGMKKYTTSINKLGGVEHLREQVLHLEKIDKMQTATLRGERHRFSRNARSAGFESILKADRKTQKNFKDFLRSDKWKELGAYDSERIYDIEDAFENGKPPEELERLWKEYEDGEVDLDQVVDKWVEYTPVNDGE